MKKDRKSPRVDIHQHVTDRIIAAIEKGAGSFEMPWHRSGLDLSRPSNVDTGRAYRGVNVVALWVAAQSRGYATGVWGTYRQWQKANAQVRKGEKATLVVFYKDFEVEEQDPATGATTTETRLFARASAVFNGDQVDGWEPAVIERPNAVEAVAQADAFVQGTGADIRHGGDRAFYRPSSDHIQMPPMEAFRDTSSSTATEGYYSTLLHELTHWTGSDKRCDRQFGQRFGDQAYAMEELVAELGAAFLCADLGITLQPRQDHAAYIASWLKALKNDKKAVFTAASKANQAVDFLTGLQPETIEAAA